MDEVVECVDLVVDEDSIDLFNRQVQAMHDTDGSTPGFRDIHIDLGGLATIFPYAVEGSEHADSCTRLICHNNLLEFMDSDWHRLARTRAFGA
jgi:hypothetical protein